MITKPRTYCPMCGREMTVVEQIAEAPHFDRKIYLAMCGCGYSELTVTRGKIVSVTLREPEKRPDFRILA